MEQQVEKMNTGYKHGTRISYMAGCRCEHCRWIEADRKRALASRYGSTKKY